jgi:adenine-specific DNA-methyltransferase
VPQTLWTYDVAGHTQEAKQELVSVLDFPDSRSVFVTPKPVRLLQRIIEVATDEDSIILDSFAGSGTTGVATLKVNAETGSRRRFVLVELDRTICQTIATERLRRVIAGHTATKPGGRTEEVVGLGGDFRYAELGETLFDAAGRIQRNVSFADLARHVFFAETGTPLQAATAVDGPMVGVAHDTAVYLLYNGILGDHSADGGNVLTPALLERLPPHPGPKVVYADGCLVGNERLRRDAITFRQIPYDVKLV